MCDGNIGNLRRIVNTGDISTKCICQPVKIALQPVMSKSSQLSCKISDVVYEDSPGSDSINEDPVLTVMFRTMFNGDLRLQNPGTPIQSKPANHPIQS